MSNKGKFRQIIECVRNTTRNKIAQPAFSFSLGLTLGYWLDLIRLHSRIAEKVLIQAYTFISNSFSSFTPDVAFLSDIIAFQGAVIAIAYPLSLEIVSRISERYSSNVIIEKFSNEWIVKALPYLIITNVIIAASLKFFYVGELSILLPKILAWLTIIIFILSTILLIIFFNILKSYAVNSKHLIDQLLIDMKELIKLKPRGKISEKELSNRQNKLIAAFEGTGDVLSYEVSRRRSDKYLIQALKEMRLVIKEFLDLRPEEFDRLLLSPEFREEQRGRPSDIQLREDYLITFTSVISQFSRIHETAIEAQNLEVGRPALYNFLQLLREMSERTGNQIFIEQVLNSFSEIRRKAVAKGDISSAYTASISSYTSIVFDSISKNFNIAYLDLFDEYFFRGVQLLISQGVREVYRGLISSLTNGIRFGNQEFKQPNDYKEELEETNAEMYARLNTEFSLDEKFESINRLYREAISSNDYMSFVEKIDSISQIKEIHQLSEKSPSLEQCLKAIKVSLAVLIKRRNLDGLVIAFGAYCLFKQRYDYIKYMWEFNQPPDSDALWLNRSIVPSTIEDVIAQYSRRSHFEEKFSIYWDDHHGAKIYFDKYFLLLLLRIIPRGVQTPEILRRKINSFQLPVSLDTCFLNDLKNRQEDYISLAGEICQTPSLIQEVGLDTNHIDLLFDEFLIPLLRELAERIENYFKQIERVKAISKAKVQEFRNDFKKAFDQNTQLRDIFVYYNLYHDSAKEAIDDLHKQLSYKQILDKTMFFEDWHVPYVSLVNDFGYQFAHSEDVFLVNNLVEFSAQASVDEFIEVLNSLQEDINNIFIIAIDSGLNDFIRRRDEFKSKLTHQELVPANTVESLVGWVTFFDYNIPVYEIYCKPNEGLILILNKDKLATVIQRPPQEGQRPRSRVDPESKVEFLYIGIDAFSADTVLMNSVLENPPPWLDEYQGEANQREYLETQVLLELNESFEFLKDEHFEGYVMRIPSEGDDISLPDQT